MSFGDPIGDMITRIRNAQLRALHTVNIPGSKFRAKILDVLKQEGYISNYEISSDVKNKSTLVKGNHALRAKHLELIHEWEKEHPNWNEFWNNITCKIRELQIIRVVRHRVISQLI